MTKTTRSLLGVPALCALLLAAPAASTLIKAQPGNRPQARPAAVAPDAGGVPNPADAASTTPRPPAESLFPKARLQVGPFSPA